MSFPIRHLAPLLASMLLLAACASGQQHATRRLNHRMETALAPDIAANRATLQRIPNGVQVTLLGASLFSNDINTMTDQRPDIRSSVIEALLDPSLIRVQVADTSTLPDDQRAVRVRNVAQYFAANGLAQVLTEASPIPAAPLGPTGLTIAVNLECPHPHDGSGYGTGLSKPVCD